jgi:hypothetical protein
LSQVNAAAVHPMVNGLSPLDLPGSFDTINTTGNAVGNDWLRLTQVASAAPAAALGANLPSMLVSDFNTGGKHIRAVFTTSSFSPKSPMKGSDRFLNRLIAWLDNGTSVVATANAGVVDIIEPGSPLGGQDAIMTITRTHGSIAEDLLVRVAFSGSATLNEDFIVPELEVVGGLNVIRIPAGLDAIDINILGVDDLLDESEVETLRISILRGGDAAHDYFLNNPTSQSYFIFDGN